MPAASAWFVWTLSQTAMTAQQIINSPASRAEFNSLSVAISYLERCVNSSKYKIVLGDNERFWILSNRLTMILLKAGYELAE